MTTNDIFSVIRQEIDALRASGAKRQKLSLHACQRLFLDHGFKPSVASVRELTRTGSATDIPKDINVFWKQVREAAQLKHTSTVLPQSLEKKANLLLNALYEEALQHAQTTFDDERQQLKDAVAQIEQTCIETQARQQTLAKTLTQHQAQSQRIQQQLIQVETQLTTALNEPGINQKSSEETNNQLEHGHLALRKQLEIEQQQSISLHEQIKTLRKELRENTEHYEQQIKNAVTEAERRVKPMLVELDTLRNMAVTYQTGLRDIQRKEFDFLQQLSNAKARADHLTKQLHEQRDEFIQAIKKKETPDNKNQHVIQELAGLIFRLAKTEQLDSEAFHTIGTSLDQYILSPPSCTKCQVGEPEWLQYDEGYELLCSKCEHTSGRKPSRFEAMVTFSQIFQ